MDVVSQLDADLDDVQTHLDYMLAGGAIVPGAHIALESTLQGGYNRLQMTRSSLNR